MIGSLFILAQASPAPNKIKNCPPESSDTNCLTVLPQVAGNADQIRNILSVVFAVAAALAVVIIIIAAINFAASEGNPDKIAQSRKTIIYALIGLVIALSAEAMVLTLIGRL